MSRSARNFGLTILVVGMLVIESGCKAVPFPSTGGKVIAGATTNGSVAATRYACYLTGDADGGTAQFRVLVECIREEFWPLK